MVLSFFRWIFFFNLSVFPSLSTWLCLHFFINILSLITQREDSYPEVQKWTWALHEALEIVNKILCVCTWWRASQVALVVKNLPANVADVRDLGSIPGLGRSSGEGHGNPLQYSCLENPMERGTEWTAVHGVAESDTTEATWHAWMYVMVFLGWGSINFIRFSKGSMSSILQSWCSLGQNFPSQCARMGSRCVLEPLISSTLRWPLASQVVFSCQELLSCHKNIIFLGLPGTPVVKTLCFQYRGAWLPSLVWELRSCMPRSAAKKALKNK